ncbi:hypothetical protein QBC37DRAFT_151646 [Rhypophila decipiens]|uniref:F-box domain-containing protein n=1 Tax=Rhypophila decipiens TaxID=261697 RepID=A0AAN6YMV4_9PEZI|nr:hypothetical protein QBC37DRAFT_151646 [Rhypophila decipiens]
MSPALVELPYELVAFVVYNLDLLDIGNLSRSCKHFQYLLHDESIAKALLETMAPETLEARCARASKRYAAELRRLIKRREAISSVSPYLVAVVGYAQEWIYENGVLCYIRERELRVLDLHRSAQSEMVVSIRGLLDEALVESRQSTRYRFQLLYCSHNIISCLYTHHISRRMNWIVVFNAKEHKIVTVRQLSTAYKIFVRNNDKFLYFGTYTEIGPQGDKNWILKAYDIKAEHWIEGSFVLTDFLGSDIGTTVCFEILGDHFYGLSNRLDPAVEEKDWTGYYTCFRFSLDPTGFRNVEKVPRERLWRRQHTDGPIDERWSFIRLFKDETTSQLKVVEARKEWLSGQSSAKRTYYTKEISFEDETPGSKSGTDLCNSDSQSGAGKVDQTLCRGPPSRDPHMVHVGDDASKSLMFTASKCPLRSYHSSCQTFIDLVDDPASLDPEKQRVRIRGGSRRRWTPVELQQRKLLQTLGTDPSQHTLDQKIEDIFKHEDVIFWPPDEDPSQPNPALSQLYQVLNPPSYSGNIDGVWDERSMLYATGGSVKALVFISWDPALYLDGVVQYPDLQSFASVSPDAETRSSSHLGLSIPELYKRQRKSEDDHNEWGPDLEPNVTEHRDTSNELGTSASTTDAHDAKWRSFQRPNYRNYASGYHFAHLRL